MEKQALLNTYINNLTMQETVEAIEQMIAANKKSYVVAINVDVVMKIEEDPYLKRWSIMPIWFWLMGSRLFGYQSCMGSP